MDSVRFFVERKNALMASLLGKKTLKRDINYVSTHRCVKNMCKEHDFISQLESKMARNQEHGPFP